MLTYRLSMCNFNATLLICSPTTGTSAEKNQIAILFLAAGFGHVLDWKKGILIGKYSHYVETDGDLSRLQQQPATFSHS